MLLDEQASAGDPAGGSPGAHCCNTSWTTPWDSSWYGPQLEPFALIDLGGTHSVSAVWLYRSYGSFNVSVSLGETPFPPGDCYDGLHRRPAARHGLD